MPKQTIEQRLSELESRVASLQAELCANQRVAKNWRRTVGAFTDDPGMQSILEDAMRLREVDRKKARARKNGKHKPSR